MEMKKKKLFLFSSNLILSRIYRLERIFKIRMTFVLETKSSLYFFFKSGSSFSLIALYSDENEA